MFTGWRASPATSWRPNCCDFFARPAISESNDFWKLASPSTSSLSVTSSIEMPASLERRDLAPGASSRASTVRRTSPWSRNASIVFGGIVFTVSGPISSSTYITSRYAGFFVLVLAHSGRCRRPPFACSARQRSAGEPFGGTGRYASFALATAALPCKRTRATHHRCRRARRAPRAACPPRCPRGSRRSSRRRRCRRSACRRPRGPRARPCRHRSPRSCAAMENSSVMLTLMPFGDQLPHGDGALRPCPAP